MQIFIIKKKKKFTKFKAHNLILKDEIKKQF